MGTIRHLSPLRAKARRLGMDAAISLAALAVRRGCRHYAPYVESIGATAPPVSETDLTNEELAVALLLGSWEYDPVLIRIAAQLLAGKSMSPDRIARLAEMERCASAIVYIARWGEATEPGNAFWKKLLALLRAHRSASAGAMPHPSRFRSETGMVDPRHPDMPRVQWLRPSPLR